MLKSTNDNHHVSAFYPWRNKRETQTTTATPEMCIWQKSKTTCQLQPNDVVRYQAGKVWKPAVIISQHSNARSYNIQTSEGTILRRNRHHLRQTKETFLPCADTDGYILMMSSTLTFPHAHNYQTSLHSKQKYFNQAKGAPGMGMLLIRPPLRYCN